MTATSPASASRSRPLRYFTWEASTGSSARLVWSFCRDLSAALPGDPKGIKGSGTSTNEWILDGWFQQRKGKGDDGRHEILEVWTYDADTKTYRAWGFMTPGANHYEGTGTWDEKANTLSYKGKGPGDVSFVSTMRFIDKDNCEATRVARDAAGKVVQDARFKLTRQK